MFFNKITLKTSIFIVPILLSLILGGCTEQPRTLAGGTLGATGGALTGIGITSMMGGSSRVAIAAGLAGAAVGGLVGAKVGNDLDQEAKQRAKQAATTGKPVVWVDDKEEEWVAMPSKKRKPTGDAVRVKIINQNTGKEVIIDM